MVSCIFVSGPLTLRVGRDATLGGRTKGLFIVDFAGTLFVVKRDGPLEGGAADKAVAGRGSFLEGGRPCAVVVELLVGRGTGREELGLVVVDRTDRALGTGLTDEAGRVLDRPGRVVTVRETTVGLRVLLIMSNGSLDSVFE